MTAEVSARYSMIRAATEEDLDRVLEIERLSFSNPWTHNYFKTGLNDVFLVFGEEEVEGFLVACVCQNIDKAVILKLAVHPDYRGKGIGGKLLRECLESLTQRGIGVVELDVEFKSKAAIRLYEKYGFEQEIIVPMDDTDDFEPFFIMKLDLRRLDEAVLS
jgi:ribosomal-protein-alanine N-acetyltransferase